MSDSGIFYMSEETPDSNLKFANEFIGENEFYEVLQAMGEDGFEFCSSNHSIYTNTKTVGFYLSTFNKQLNQYKHLYFTSLYAREEDSRIMQDAIYTDEFESANIDSYFCQGGFNYSACVYDKIKMIKYRDYDDFERFVVVTHDNQGFYQIFSFGDYDNAVSFSKEFIGGYDEWKYTLLWFNW